MVVEGDESASPQGYLKTIGVSDEEMKKPFVGIINSWSEFYPGHAHLLALAQEVKAGVWAGGGVPFEGNTISLCDALCLGHEGMKWALPSRGPCIGHVSPEAMEGGPIVLVRDGDPLFIDIPERKLEILISPEEMEETSAYRVGPV